MVRDDEKPSHPATVVRVPADAPMHKGRERPVTVSFGWKHPAVATYAVTPVGDARVRIDPFDGQPEHTLGSIEFLAKIVAGEPAGEPFDDE